MASAHPGFKAAASSIASRQHLPLGQAKAILAAEARKASPAARKANPRLKRVKPRKLFSSANDHDEDD